MKVVDLHYAIGPTLLFKNFHFHFPMGKIIGLIGTNGSGKSTLLKIVAGLNKPQAGAIFFEGHDLYENRSLQSTIGYAPSAPFLYPFLTIQENWKWLTRQRDIPTHWSESLFHQFDLKPYAKQLFGKLSDGVKKRTGIASVFLHHPRLLILDEPCQGLDPSQRHHLWNYLKNFSHATRLLLISSHYPEELTSFCDEIYLLSNGKLLHYFPSPTFSQYLWKSIATLPTLQEGSIP